MLRDNHIDSRAAKADIGHIVAGVVQEEVEVADVPREPQKKALPEPDFDMAFGNSRPAGPRAETGDPLAGRQNNAGQPVARPDATQLRPETTQQKPAEIQKPAEAARPADTRQPGGDRADKPELQIVNRTLELSYRDPQFNRKLENVSLNNQRDFDAIKIKDVPQGVTITPWVDSRGFYFYFNDGKPLEKHYIPNNVTTLESKGVKDMNELRQQIMIAYDQDISKKTIAQSQGFGGFFNFDRRSDPARDGANSAYKYFLGMGTQSGQVLDSLEVSLREAVKTSENPYLKIWLADVYVGQAMRNVTEQAISGAPINLKNEYITRKLNDAISLNHAAKDGSDTTLERSGMKRQGNAFMPMMPFNPYWDARGNRNGYYAFWGGSGDQANYREASLRLIKGMIDRDALPKMQLPPYMPPRQF